MATQRAEPINGLPSEKIPLKTHLSYGLSQWGLNGINTAFGVSILFFYTTVLKFDSVLFGIAMLIGQVWDAVTDPMMGHISDNTRRWTDRRRPYFLLGAIPYSIAFFLIFSPPALQSTPLMFVYFLTMLLIMFTGRTVFETPYLALAPEMTADYDERTRLSGYKQFFGVFGDAQGAILPLLIFNLLHENRRLAHLWYGLLASLMMIVFASITQWGTFERPAAARKTAVSILDSFKAVAKNRPYLLFIFSSTAAQIGNNIVTYLVLFITKYWFLNERLAPSFLITFFAGCLVGVPVWARLTTRFDKKWTYIVDMAGYGTTLLCVLVFPRDMVYAIYAVMFLSGVFNVGLWVLAYTIGPDIIEWDEYHTGKRREGVYSGVWTFVYKAGVGIALAIVGLALRIIKFDPSLEVQTDSALLGLKLLFGAVSGAFLIAGALAFIFFPITRQKHEEIRRLIRQRDATTHA
jgi:GPH family glycoside/pentoside/hexuronide:cation symporter